MVHKNSPWLPHLDPQSNQPLYEQLVESVALAVAAGELRPGDELPSVRGLATGLRINPNTAARALRAMEREGLSRAVRGVGSVVAEDARRHAEGRARQALDRELDATVGVARRLGLELESVIAALRLKWKGE
jgi:GntR family transcriptional regulator